MYITLKYIKDAKISKLFMAGFVFCMCPGVLDNVYIFIAPFKKWYTLTPSSMTGYYGKYWHYRIISFNW